MTLYHYTLYHYTLDLVVFPDFLMAYLPFRPDWDIFYLTLFPVVALPSHRFYIILIRSNVVVIDVIGKS